MRRQPEPASQVRQDSDLQIGQIPGGRRLSQGALLIAGAARHGGSVCGGGGFRHKIHAEGSAAAGEPGNGTYGQSLRLFGLPAYHGDPFDRMLIATALAEDVAIVAGDREFKKYKGVRVIW